MELRRNGDVAACGTIYHICSASHADYPAVKVIQEVLTDEPSGRLYKALVESGMAARVNGVAYGWKEPAAMLNMFARDEEREQRLFLLVWFIGMFCFFTLSQAKQGKYILPLFPAIALIVGRFWDDVIFDRQSLSYTKCIFVPVTFIAIVMVFGSAVGTWLVNNNHPEFLKVSLPMGMLFALSGAAMFITALF